MAMLYDGTLVWWPSGDPVSLTALQAELVAAVTGTAMLDMAAQAYDEANPFALFSEEFETVVYWSGTGLAPVESWVCTECGERQWGDRCRTCLFSVGPDA